MQLSATVSNIMRSGIVSLEKLLSLEMDKFVIRSGGSKPETAEELENLYHFLETVIFC